MLLSHTVNKLVFMTRQLTRSVCEGKGICQVRWKFDRLVAAYLRGQLHGVGDVTMSMNGHLTYQCRHVIAYV